MPDDITISEIRVIEMGEQTSAPTDSTLALGDAARFDVTDGELTGANGTDAVEDNYFGLVINIDAGQMVTVAGAGSLLTLGTALASLDYNATLYLSDTDKKLSGTSGDSTTTRIFGFIEAVRNQGTVYKALRIARRLS